MKRVSVDQLDGFRDWFADRGPLMLERLISNGLSTMAWAVPGA